MGWACGAYGWGEGGVRVFLGKPEGRRPLGRPRRRWVDNIRTDLQRVGCGYMDWIGLAQDRYRWRTLVSAIMNLRVPWNADNFLTSCKPVSFSRRTLHHVVGKNVRASLICFQSKTNRMWLSHFFYFCKTLYIFQTGFPSIIRSSKLQIQHQVFVIPTLLPAASLKAISR